MKTTFTLDELKKAAEKYDESIGEWPENKHEGKSFYEWLVDVNDCEWFLELFK